MNRPRVIKDKIYQICLQRGYDAHDARLPNFIMNNLEYIFYCLVYAKIVDQSEYDNFLVGATTAYLIRAS